MPRAKSFSFFVSLKLLKGSTTILLVSSFFSVSKIPVKNNPINTAAIAPPTNPISFTYDD